jgi:cobalt/nickel transport system permease protein
MHIPDGFFDVPTSAGAAVAAAGVLGIAVRRTRGVLDDRQIPLAALTAAFVFAAQMVNFPVVAGTSGHLLGGALAAVLVGPWTGIIAVTVVVAVQALFADGGLSALGLNALLIAVVPVVVGWLVFRLLRTAVPRTRGGLSVAAAVAAGLSVPAAAAAFTGLYALGGNAPVDLAAVAVAMVGTHLLIGVGEAVITGFVVATVLASRPDLVHGAAGHAAAEPPLTPAMSS